MHGADRPDHAVAAATESQGPLKLLSEIAFGGGGMLLSVTLGGLLKPHASWCVQNLNETIAIGGGDGLLTYCTAHLRNPKVPAVMLRNESLIGTVIYHDSLHRASSLGSVSDCPEFDVAHDAAGLFQSGQEVVSFHVRARLSPKLIAQHAVHGWYHLYPRHHFDPLVRTDTDVTAVALMQQAAALLGGDNMFRRFVFDDGRAMVCLGYTITIYNEPLTPFDLTRIGARRDLRLADCPETTWPEPLPPRKDLIVRPGIPEGRPPGSDDPDFKTTYFLRSIKPFNKDQFELLHSNMRGEVVRLIWARG